MENHYSFFGILRPKSPGWHCDAAHGHSMHDHALLVTTQWTLPDSCLISFSLHPFSLVSVFATGAAEMTTIIALTILPDKADTTPFASAYSWHEF